MLERDAVTRALPSRSRRWRALAARPRSVVRRAEIDRMFAIAGGRLTIVEGEFTSEIEG